jgi:LacI family transcriptional regulator
MQKIPTLRDLAAVAGVSHQTVALALRNSTRISAGTRRRLRALARKSGYRRNPAVSAWVSYVRTKKAVAERDTLAFVIPISPHAARKGDFHFYSEFYHGARKEADSLGYRLDFFTLTDYNNNWLRIRNVMKARNIRGCLIFCQFLGGNVELPLDDLAVVSLDRAPGKVEIDFACADHYRVMTVALHNLRRLGYRRIGFYGNLNPNIEDLLRCRGAFAADLIYRNRDERIPMGELKIERPPSQSFLKWWRKHRPEAIISSFGYEVPILQQEGICVPRDVAIAKLDVFQNDRFFSGVDQRLPWVAAAAVRLLADKLEKNEMGPPGICRGITIQPAWKNGKSAPAAQRGK